MLRNLFFTIVVCFATSLSAQDTPEHCGEIEPSLCALIDTTARRWNGLFGEQVRITGFEYAGESNKGEIYALYDTGSQAKALTVDPETGSLILTTIDDLIANSDPDQVGATQMQLFEFAGRFTHLVTIHWESEGQDFETTALVSDSYPYLLDTMIASVLIAVQPETTDRNAVRCMAVEYQLASYVTIGECRASLYSARSRSPSGGAFYCDKKLSAYNRIGGHSIKSTDLRYDEQGCNMDVVCGLTTPFASVTIGGDPLSAEIGGLGGGWTFEESCRLLRGG